MERPLASHSSGYGADSRNGVAADGFYALSEECGIG
jgi:hypothetical protein